MSDAPRTLASPRDVHFTTLGMFIIDEIHYGPSTARIVASDIIGGAGTYAVLGARIFSPETLGRTIHWIVDTGSDIPPNVLERLKSFGTSMHLREDSSRLTTRGYNYYPPEDSTSADEHRDFHYLTPKKRLTVEDLQEFDLVHTRSLHLCCSPQRCIEEVTKLAKVSGGNTTILVWEPIPDLCAPEYRESMLRAARMVDVVSPNHEELGGFFEDREIATVEELSARITVGPKGQGGVVVRAGRRGCYVRGGSSTEGCWLPPFYEGSKGMSHPMVIDPTGGGNTFVGGLAIGISRGQNMIMAAAMGTVAASFAIEQMGLPSLSAGPNDNRWNGVDPMERMDSYLRRLGRIGLSI